MRLIDADALSELLVKTYEKAPTEKALLFVALLLKNSEQVPTVEPDRPHGEWITRYDTEWHFECNQCKGLSPWKAQFCGVCGADMRGDKK